jgi:hypothetical protein
VTNPETSTIFYRKLEISHEMCIAIDYNRNFDNTNTTKSSTFQVNRRNHKTYLRYKQNLDAGVVRRQCRKQPESIFKDPNISYQTAERARAIGFGGIGAMHKFVCKLRLDQAIINNVLALECHVPYRESDRAPNIACNVLTRGPCLEDIERFRNDETNLNLLDAESIPVPIAAGDFLRRFDETYIFTLQEAFNESKTTIWLLQDISLLKEAIINVNETIAGTSGECKQRMDVAYNRS